MPARKPAPDRDKHPGPATAEWQRKTEAVKLRLPPDVAEQLRARAAQQEATVSDYVARLIRQDLQIV